MNTKKLRQSNFELLRVLAICIIIFCHIACHCITDQITSTGVAGGTACEYFGEQRFYPQLLLIYFILPFGAVGNTIFIMISGYFSVKKGSSLNLAKITKRLLFEVCYAAVLLVVGSTLLYRYFKAVGSGAVNLLQIHILTSMAWFVGYYFLIMLTAKLFLNKYLCNLEKKKYQAFLMIALAVVLFGFTGRMVDSLATGLRTYGVGDFIYALGGYVQKYDPFEKIRVWALAALLLAANALILITGYNAVKQRVESGGATFAQPFPGYENYSLVTVVLGVVVFELFKRLKMPNLRVINFCGGSTLVIYLLHDNSLFYSLWAKINWPKYLYLQPARFVLLLAAVALATFAVGVLAYVLYLGLGKLFKRCSWLFLKKQPSMPAVESDTANS